MQTLNYVEVLQVIEAFTTNREVFDKIGYLLFAYCRNVLLHHLRLH